MEAVRQAVREAGSLPSAAHVPHSPPLCLPRYLQPQASPVPTSPVPPSSTLLLPLATSGLYPYFLPSPHPEVSPPCMPLHVPPYFCSMPASSIPAEGWDMKHCSSLAPQQLHRADIAIPVRPLASVPAPHHSCYTDGLEPGSMPQAASGIQSAGGEQR